MRILIELIDVKRAVILLGIFFVIGAWFNLTDVYHDHFFDHGTIIFLDNVVRTGFIAVLVWLVYAPGAAAIAVLLNRWGDGQPTSLERGVVAFAIGAAIWHALLLILGVAGLYYRAVMAVLCAAVLLLSSQHFAVVSGAARQAICAQFGRAPRTISAATTGAVFFIVCAVWLLLVRGLYPGGSGDYYTHYFYYYMDVINNHGLQPNDVWYHYYYSKGYGLFFLGILLTDPEAPTLVTFVFVLAAAAGLIALGERMAPRTLWPWWLAALYLMFNLVNFDLNLGGGDFQKDHEQVSGLIALMAVALCLARSGNSRIWLTAAAASGLSIAIIAQPMGVIVGAYLMLLAAWAAARRQWQRMCWHGLVGAAIGGTVGALLILNYWATGLFSDELIGVMLRFADIARLDRWGVVPQLPIIAWIRDNYRSAPLPWGPGIWELLRHFLWLDTLWVVLAGAAVAVGCGAARNIVVRVRHPPPSPAAAVPTMSAIVMTETGLMVMILTLISLAVGWEQPVSFLRSSTFFFPLLLMLAAGSLCWALAGTPARWRGLVDRALPALLLAGTVAFWSGNSDWLRRTAAATENALRFFTGAYSLADGYSHQGYGLPYGGIDPHTWAAAQQVPPGTPIWSTNVASYCMVPGCRIESVVSFIMSPQLDKILVAPPTEADQLLRQAGLNYFLISKDAQLIDLLPYSKLFAADAIDRHLGLKWTDGSVYLLSWIDNGTTPLSAEFKKVYADRLAQRELAWFEFSRLAPILAQAAAALRAKRWGAPIVFAWRAPPDGTVDVIEASYGLSCRGYATKPPAINAASEGNVTGLVHRACLNQASCRVHVDVGWFGDPASGCAKDFSVLYRCRHGGVPKAARVPAEAHGHSVSLDCASP